MKTHPVFTLRHPVYYYDDGKGSAMADRLLIDAYGDDDENEACEVHPGVECEYDTDTSGNPTCPCRKDCCLLEEVDFTVLGGERI